MSSPRWHQCIASLLADASRTPAREQGEAFAPANIALVKYWGKRDPDLNLPCTSSLSVALGNLGATTRVSLAEADALTVNGQSEAPDGKVGRRLFDFLDPFRPTPETGFCVDTVSTIPLGAGLASSASGFAAMVNALDHLFGWDLPVTTRSILARIGSGSAARSVYGGFVEWQAGEQDDGSDSFAVPVESAWENLRVGLVTLSDAPKPVGSREGMNRTTATSALYRAWPDQVARDLPRMRDAIRAGDFSTVGPCAEQNALAMHATMWSAWPPVIYQLPETVALLHEVHAARADGLPVFATMDAGPNVKLLFEAASTDAVTERFANVRVVNPFG